MSGVNTQTEANTSPQSNSNSYKGTAEIAALSQQAETLSSDVRWYDWWKDRADALSVGLALLVFVAAYAGNRLGARLNRTNKEVIAVKERLSRLQVEEVRTEADVKIGDARAIGSQADERAGEANEEAGRANVRASELELQAQNQARENLAIRSGVASLEKEAADAKRRQAEAERTVLEMQTALAPRLIDTATASENLKRFAGTKVIVECMKDFEANETAGQIMIALSFADWEIVGLNLEVNRMDGSRFFDGVEIKTAAGTPTEGDKALIAAEALRAELKANKIETVGRPINEAALPPNTVLVRVGLKPFTNLRIKKWNEIMRRRNQQERQYKP